MTAGETDLKTLLETMEPILAEGVFVFCTTQDPIPRNLKPQAIFEEQEGTTLILKKEQALAAGLPFEGTFRMITLSVHSSLEAVGFLAAVASRLAEAGLSVNPVAGYFHDHLFIPESGAEKAMGILKDFQKHSNHN